MKKYSLRIQKHKGQFMVDIIKPEIVYRSNSLQKIFLNAIVFTSDIENFQNVSIFIIDEENEKEIFSKRIKHEFCIEPGTLYKNFEELIKNSKSVRSFPIEPGTVYSKGDVIYIKDYEKSS